MQAAIEVKILRTATVQHHGRLKPGRCGQWRVVEVNGGVIGSEKLTFDLWGNTVNLASRIESAGLINKVNLSSDTHNLIKYVFD